MLAPGGCAGKLELMRESAADVIGLDWAVDMKDARQQLAGKRVQVGWGEASGLGGAAVRE